MTDSILFFLGEFDGRREGLAGVNVGLFSELVSILEIAEKQGLYSARALVKDALLPRVRSLTNGILRPRLMKEAGRSAMRSSKIAFVLSSASFYLESCLNWTSLPCDFSSYVRGVPEPCEALEEAESAFDRIGCSSLALSSRKRHPSTEKESGFQKLSIKRASMILAKSCGYEPVRNGRECILHKRENSHVFRSLVFPLCLVKDLVSSDLFNVLNLCDSQGIFDHYIAVVPILGDSDGTVESLRGSISSGVVNPVVLGEREGICYFVGLFF